MSDPQKNASVAAEDAARKADEPSSAPDLAASSPAEPVVERARQRSLRFVYLLPLGFFACLALVFLMRLGSGDDPQAVPSALIGRPAPQFDLPALEGEPLFTRAMLEGKTTIVNIWASWCGPCRLEHPILMDLAKEDGLQVVGINYKDQPANARRFLEELGNPYAAVATDSRGRAAIEWGVYGVPETFVVGPDGVILHKIIGPLTAENVERGLKPAVSAAVRQ